MIDRAVAAPRCPQVGARERAPQVRSLVAVASRVTAIDRAARKIRSGAELARYMAIEQYDGHAAPPIPCDRRTLSRPNVKESPVEVSKNESGSRHPK